MKLQNGLCAICGKPMLTAEEAGDRFRWKVVTLDHIVSRDNGGPDHWENTQAVHLACNREKGRYERNYKMTDTLMAKGYRGELWREGGMIHFRIMDIDDFISGSCATLAEAPAAFAELVNGYSS